MATLYEAAEFFSLAIAHLFVGSTECRRAEP
jgi:hypothetical protein